MVAKMVDEPPVRSQSRGLPAAPLVKSRDERRRRPAPQKGEGEAGDDARMRFLSDP